MEFLNVYAFLALSGLLIPLVFKNSNLPFNRETAEKIVFKGKISKKTKFYILCTAYVLLVTALARPVINNGWSVIKAPEENVVVALDVSKEMDKKDLYPNRYEFAKNRIKKLLGMFKTQNTALILFDKNTYLISPPTKDYDSLKYLLDHVNLKDIIRSPKSDIKNLITSARKLVKNPKIVIFTYQPYIPENNDVFVYLCSKEKLNAKNVFNASFSDDGLKEIAKSIKGRKKEIKIKNNKELFYYPLALSLILLFFVLFFPPRRIK